MTATLERFALTTAPAAVELAVSSTGAKTTDVANRYSDVAASVKFTGRWHRTRHDHEETTR
jgi:hypothetical protein